MGFVPTAFVDAGTALANLTRAMGPSRRRNIFAREVIEEMVVVEESAEIFIGDTVRASNLNTAVQASTVTTQPTSRTHSGGASLNRKPTLSSADWIQPKPYVTAEQQVTAPLAIWEGVVDDIDENQRVFYATLIPKTMGLDEHVVEISFDEIDDSDQYLLALGAVFYFEQYQRNARGVKEKAQFLRFRRCVVWNERTVEWVKTEAAIIKQKIRPYVPPADSD